MRKRLALPLCGIIMIGFFCFPLTGSGSSRLYTATYKSPDESGQPQLLIDGGPAYFLYRSESDPSEPAGSYLRYTDLAEAQSSVSIQTEQVLALLGAGYPLDIGGLEKLYGLTDAEAYRLTQKALWILTGQEDEPEPSDQAGGQAAYLDELVAAGQKAVPALSRLHLSPDTVRFVQTDRDFRTGTIQSNLLAAGSLDFSGLPPHIDVLSEEGERISSPAAAGIRFVLVSDTPVAAGTLTIRYICPEPVLYRYETDGNPHGTIVRVGHHATETVPVKLTVENTEEAPASQNPGTGVTIFTAVCILALAAGCLLLLFVPIRRRRR